MAENFTLACVQVNAGADMTANIKAASRLVRKAREKRADLVALPENVAMMEFGHRRILAAARPEADHPALIAFCDLAREQGVWLHIGSLTVRLKEEAVANRSFLISDSGEVVARYDKIHLFDVDLPNGESYRESRTFRPGSKAVVAKTPWARFGLSICYDLRFPHLYRSLAKGGAELLGVPSAFTRQTGQAHWHVLLRARAIENGCFIYAPAQCGEHANGRQTFGHSLIIDPWGKVLADAGEEPGVVLAEIDLARVREARAALPSLHHDRNFTGPVI
jgi:predicted amidohydrolase